MRVFYAICLTSLAAFSIQARSQDTSQLRLVQTITLQHLREMQHDGLITVKRRPDELRAWPFVGAELVVANGFLAYDVQTFLNPVREGRCEPFGGHRKPRNE